MLVKKNDTVTLSDGNRSQAFVVIGFSRTHAHLATVANYNSSMERHGEYNRMAYGYKAWNLRSGAVQKGFWALLETVNGVAYESPFV